VELSLSAEMGNFLGACVFCDDLNEEGDDFPIPFREVARDGDEPDYECFTVIGASDDVIGQCSDNVVVCENY